MPNTIQDGAMAYGSISIVVDGVTYILNTFNVSRPNGAIIDTGAKSIPSRALYYRELESFSANAQVATGTTAFPQFGDTFLATVDATIGEEKWIVLGCEPQISKEMTTLELRGNKAINPSAITVSTET